MRKYKKVTRKVEVLAEVHCDRCLKQITDDMEMQELTSIHLEGGYSSVFGDGVRVEADLCQHCLKDLIGEFCNYS